jgi:uncharacterized protein (UPF0261 family)
MTRVAILGTCDTKLDELLFLRDAISQTNVETTLIDVGRHSTQHESITITQKELLKEHGDNQDVSQMPRGELVKVMASCATKAVKSLYDEKLIQGIVAAGGSGGTSIASLVMRNALPVGFPKLIVSTVASGDTGPIVGHTDLTMMYSVVDVAGLNDVLRNVLTNAGAAISGMALSYSTRSSLPSGKKRVGITMFGVTTPAVDAIREHLETNYDIETYIFHATGHGGMAMEQLIQDRKLDAVLDLTTTEICDLITGGVMSAGPDRLEAAARAGIPNIVSLGATDMANFGPRNTVPERYQERKLYEHNSLVTLMRTSAIETRQVGEFIAKKLKDHARDQTVIQVWLPMGGLSMIATPGGPFADADADAELFQAIKEGLAGSDIKVIEDKRDVNDTGFAKAIAEALISKMGLRPMSG